ncbi:ABC transporter permease DevC [Cylindrospermum sp. FACHB-282]|uniref:ABC transporter permease DevC n=1 Tax=Cylindrospermum sp. FACHB-282 TaxID=2692794 RepID=UPI0016830306|nr:ABC transporter permease DevC [Cylindrospermum sp. FACHB-282]MBD2385961.1 FtsX-like permease family protein [Cylindrospermum sp. FACHB-282]
MSKRIPLAWLQLMSKKNRLLVVLAGIAFSTLLIFMQLGFQVALYDSATEIHKKFHADLILTHPRVENLIDVTYRLHFPNRRLYQALSIDGVESANSLYVRFADWKNPSQSNNRAILIFSFDPEDTIFDIPDINASLDKIKLPDVVLFDRLSRWEFGSVVSNFEQGQEVSTEVNNRKITVVGLFSLGGSIFSADGILMTSDLNFIRLFNENLQNVSLGLVNIKPNANVQVVKENLIKELPQDVKVLTHKEFIELEKKYWANSSTIGYIFSLGAMMGFIVGAVIVYQILYTDVTEHLAQYATLKAIGYTQNYLLSLVLQEALILAVLGYIPGFLISSILYELTKNASRLPMNMDLNRALFVFILTFLMCLISGAIAMLKLRDADPADIFN